VESPGDAEDFEARLRELAKLKNDGLISDDEYEHKRAQIMNRL
jgi:cytochrome c-type biogenesis protein CcmH/NrfG